MTVPLKPTSQSVPERNAHIHGGGLEAREVRNMKRSDLLLIVVISGLLVYWIAVIIYPWLTSPFNTMYLLLLDISMMMGYAGSLIVSFLGNAIVLVPFPYVGVPFVLGGLRDAVSSVFLFDPTLVGLLAGIGACLGEMTGYFIGYLGGQLLDEKHTDGFRHFVHCYPRATPIVVWFLAATPLPDDVVVVPLGAARYPWWKVFVPQLIGKSMFLVSIAWAGRFGLDWVGQIFAATESTSIVSRSTEVVAILLVVIAIYLLVRVDWSSMTGSRIVGACPTENLEELE
jgi:membrane protein YqaA with SNARE-associated domain